jgi:hypothetical protein
MPEFLESLSSEQAEQFWKLVKLYQITRKSFVAFAIFGQAADWNDIEGTLRLESSLNLHLISVPSHTISADDPNFLPALRAIGSKRSLVLIRVDYGASDAALITFAGYLNLHREELMHLPHGFVFWLTEAALTVVARVAPDTYAIKRAVLDFRIHPASNVLSGHAAAWSNDQVARLERIQELAKILELERSSATPDFSYISRLKLRIAEAENQSGFTD